MLAERPGGSDILLQATVKLLTDAPSGLRYLNKEDAFWDLYLQQAKSEDEHRVERWKGETEGILIFVRASG